MTDISVRIEDAFEAATATDDAVGVVRGVKLLGLRSRNRRNYDTPGVRKSAPAMLNGARVYLDHPPSPDQPRSYRDSFGVIEGYEYREGQGHFGTIRFNPKHPLAEQFAWDVKNNPKGLGMSINGRIKPGKTDRDGDVVVEQLEMIRSVDIVTRPGTADGIFEHEEAEEQSVPLTLDELKKSHPDVYEAAVAESAKGKQAAEEAEALQAELRKAKEALEQVQREREQEKLLKEVSEQFSSVLEKSALEDEDKKFVLECACQMAAEDRGKLAGVFEKLVTATDDDDDTDDETPVDQEEQHKEDPPPRIGGKQRGYVSLRDSLGLKKS